ncbi:MAG: hypothetical protein E6J90_02435 [Deltaproteobacteria bacterium]|nr:MAG: hypothetical protein E6J91_13625 [Deltaproteobacteria bacterium]TMQ27519.1 MAG: hypothetical protein E6J90_02435 [Deltaproteobacteria bacterium]
MSERSLGLHSCSPRRSSQAATNEPPRTAAATATDTVPASARTATSTAMPVIDVSADQLHRDYDTNEVNADERYRGKLLRSESAAP